MSLPSPGDEILDAVRQVHWSQFDDADPGRTELAFRLVLTARSEGDGETAYDRLVDVLAHEHSGWVRRSAIPAGPLLVRVVEQCAGIPRSTALAVLVDLVSWSTAGSASVEVGEALRGAAQRLTPLLNRLTAGRQNKAIARSAGELLRVLG
ncbi:hypothetical protein Val02_30100 [Virgisporangium aliadipatigenens]|uniref:Uncharacterized protein n=1 Tax=Virgisporangium aliadipatigenens TaxID=741659 RepID=A0A8J3YIT0_9ACTN|nr:hypothetical protein [Virgisporangium aliadipatigenens]GIJ46124.1 hypothetical protein Val02_30100 [Virgisporangium aliadipatigenens]